MKKLLEDMKKYIEDMEVDADQEWGSARALSKLIADNAMPEIYSRVLVELSKHKD